MFDLRQSKLRSSPFKAALLVCSVLGAASAFPVGARAQQGSDANANADDDRISDIVVTAQRRDERLQDVPISVSAVTAKALENSGVKSSADLYRLVPSLTVNTTNGRFFPRIRGIGNEITNPAYENGVATYIDGVYVASTAGGIMTLSNVDRIEVLKGPQGTLFGRNSTGGLINVITRKPTQQLNAEITLGYANYQTVTADGYVTGGLTDTIAMDLAGHISHQGKGYGINNVTGKDVYQLKQDQAVRSSILGDFGSVQVRVTGDYSLRSGSTNPTTTAPHSYPAGGQVQTFSNPWDVAIDTDPYSRLETYGVSGRIDIDAGFGKLSSVTAYRKANSFVSIDGDTTALPTTNIYLNQFDKQVSEELQLASHAGSPVSWIVGAHYFDANSGYDPARVHFNAPFNPPVPGIPSLKLAEVRNRAILTTRAIAAFGQVTVPLSESTNLTGGFRYTWEKRTIEATGEIDILNGPTGIALPSVALRTLHVSKPTWRVSLDHRFSPELMVYASYNRGFKSGGYNANAPTDAPYRPEMLDAYEVGFKSDLLDRRLRLNVAGFYYDYSDIQIARYIGGATIIYNGGDARTYGLDMDFELRPIDGLTLNGGVSLLNAKFTHAPGLFFYVPRSVPPYGNQITIAAGDGNSLPYSPDFTTTLGVQYEIPTSFGSVVLGGNYYRSTSYFTNADNVLNQPTFGLINADLSFRLNSGLELRFFGQNLANKAVSSSQNCSPSSCAITFRAPRTYGVTVGAKF